MRRQLLPAVLMLVVMTLGLGLAYPLVVTGVAQLAWPDRADGSLVTDAHGRVVGSALLAQDFSGDAYFHPRPSAAGDGWDPTASGASNLGPSHPDLAALVEDRVAAYREENGLPDDVRVPVDAVTASGSGLDPHISVANARLQAPRVATARDLPESRVLALVEEHTVGRTAAVLGETSVDVLGLNLALDGQG